jgi:pimeloyl-ACP methyl ester carboxylesterase
MAVEHARHEHAAAEAEHEVAHAPEPAAAPTQFHTEGAVPAVGAAHDAASHPTASELAYDGGQPFISGDLMYEQLAHRFAYRDTLTAEDQKWLKEQGLQMNGLVHGRHGFAMMSFVPLPGFDGVRRPTIAFRGSDDAHDALDDFNEHGVGAAQMAANEGTIARTLTSMQCYAKEPAVTGHSLGGALAQMAAARFPDLIAKVVTFQSPGISREMVKRVEGANAESRAAGKGERVHSHHFQVDGDLVGKSGEAMTPGELSQINRPTGYMLRHTGMVTDYADKNPDKRTVVDTADRQGGKLEGLRAGFGKFLGALQDITNTGPQEYVETWDRVRHAVDVDADPATIRDLIDHSKLSSKDKSYMREQLDGVLAASTCAVREPEVHQHTGD